MITILIHKNFFVLINNDTYLSKRREFGLDDEPSDEDIDDLYEGGFGGGGSGVPSPVSPSAPMRSGMDARAFPPVDDSRDP